MHEFMVPGHDLNSDETWKMGDDNQFRRWQRSGLVDERTLRWGEWPTARTLAQIRWLKLETRDKTIIDVPKGLEALDRLEYLKCPYWFLKGMNTRSLPRSLRTLQLSGAGSATAPKKQVLTGIRFLYSPDCAVKFTRENLPDLTRLIVKLDAGATMLENLATYDSLEGIHLSNVSVPNLFARVAPLSPRYVGVYIGEFADLAGIGELAGLTDLFLKSLPSLKSLNHLEEAASLRELTVSYCRALSDASSIATLPQLKKLMVHDCPKLDLNELRAMAKQLGIKDPFIA